MSNIRNAVRKICISLLYLTAIFVTTRLYAGDEDISPSVYQQFDPVTGYMILVESPPVAQQNHPLREVDANITTDSLDNQAENSARPQLWIYLLAVTLIGGGFAAWKRNKDKVSSGDLY